ncbi:hypothetical protein F4553_005231 [Allocatelliglobosispora scoriae]|uniref:Uncharacterized protein n=1 Tax=Allocatelliglobosispora scoriae TaxID=643052 RepID=A0A841BYH8_9ACTN|nr:hypothetical protein [Allocatelliglobosispora scoriae]MBB5871852.1 hypothetical protein [Allocatelliglobosispora scoriae]
MTASSGHPGSVITQGVAALGAGCLIGFWGVLTLPAQALQGLAAMRQSDYPTTDLLLYITATLITIAAGAVAVAAAHGLRINGWALSAGGFAIAAACFDRNVAAAGADPQLLFAIAAVATGLAIAGTVVAFGTARSGTRTAIGLGLGTGTVVGSIGIAVNRSADLDLPITWREGTLLVFAVLALAAALVGRGVEGRTTERSWRSLSLVAVVVTACSMWLLPVLISDATADSQLTAEALTPLAIAVGSVLAYFAMRQGGVAAVRLTALMVGLAPLLIHHLPFPPHTARLVTAGVVATLAGAAAARRLGRFAPWDAVGVLIGFIGLSIDELVEVPFAVSSTLLAAGIGIGLGAGLVGFARAAAESSRSVATSLLTALTALMLTAQILVDVSQGKGDDPLLWESIIGVAVIVALVMSFIVSSMVARRFRRDPA